MNNMNMRYNDNYDGEDYEEEQDAEEPPPLGWGPNEEDLEPMNDGGGEGGGFGGPMPIRGGRRGRGRGYQSNFGNQRFNNMRYSNAYGDYRGGYGPGGGYGPPPDYFGGPRFYGPPRGPPGNMGPPPLMGQGYGQTGPLKKNYFSDQSVKYLLRCGVPRENVKGLPKRLLKLIDPQYCGVCAISFDSYAMSRMHYVSKNHTKKTKNFLKTGESEFRRAKELPMKSRDLYCELCDVQITSKAHADAHYAGRPHRSIVEGRKQPKNPILLQRGMEARVEQLIRREKKALKVAEDAEQAQPLKDEEKKITSPPELYCEICKTCVTCSEQMTMHLNGKRHLSKEKQHILKMMRGDKPKKEANDEESKNDEEAGDEGDEVEEEEEEDGEGEMEGEEKEENKEQAAEEKNASDDWENNGEKWEDASIY